MGEPDIRGNFSHGDGVYKSVDAGKTWTHSGLGDSRQIGRIAVHPSDPDLVYVAALGHVFGPNAERGLYRSSDGGEHWEQIAPQVDFILCSWNCDNDPAHHPIQKSRRMGIPSAWSDRTGLVYDHEDYRPNRGSAGLVDAEGHVIARSPPGVEQIVVGELTW